MVKQNELMIGLAFVALVISGCVAPSNITNTGVLPSDSTIPDYQPNVVQDIGPGQPVVLCDSDNLEENAECFEEALVACQRVVGTFWSTSDGFPLAFESVGLNEEGKCSVRVTVLSDDTSETPFAGTSANCLIDKSPANDEHSTAFFDSYLIGPNTCAGTYVDAINTTVGAEPAPTEQSVVPVETTAPVKEFSIMVSEKGVVGEKTFTVQKGDLVKLTITVDVKDVSFNGEQIIAPAQKGLEASEYIFDSGHQKPGQVQTFEFVANESFDFGVYWPGPTVLKGKGNFVVEGN